MLASATSVKQKHSLVNHTHTLHTCTHTLTGSHPNYNTSVSDSSCVSTTACNLFTGCHSRILNNSTDWIYQLVLSVFIYFYFSRIFLTFFDCVQNHISNTGVGGKDTFAPTLYSLRGRLPLPLQSQVAIFLVLAVAC